MENINLLDPDNDILNIIGDVKQDNTKRIRKENNFDTTDFIINRLKRKNIFIKRNCRSYS